jgi:hypothetical protein
VYRDTTDLTFTSQTACGLRRRDLLDHGSISSTKHERHDVRLPFGSYLLYSHRLHLPASTLNSALSLSRRIPGHPSKYYLQWYVSIEELGWLPGAVRVHLDKYTRVPAGTGPGLY